MGLIFKKVSYESRDLLVDCGEIDMAQKMNEAYLMTANKQGLAYNVFLDGEHVGQFMISIACVRGEKYVDSYYSSTARGDQHAAVKLEYIAVKKENQNIGIGTVMLEYALRVATEIMEKAPIRFVVLEAVQDRCEWYEKRGFVKATKSGGGYTVPMYLDTIDQEEIDYYLEATV